MNGFLPNYSKLLDDPEQINSLTFYSALHRVLWSWKRY
jgi:hypothetical protein